MTKKVLIVVSLVIVAGLLLAACERSASQPPLATQTAVGTNGTPQSLGLQHLQDLGTQTAMYVQTEVAAGVFTAVPTMVSSLSSATPVGAQTTPSSSTLVPPVGLPTPTLSTGTTPLPLPVISFATATPGHPASYTLHAGEFPYCIARRFDVDPGALMSLNGLSTGEIVQPGMTLSIPATGSFPGTRALLAHPVQYTVAVNDTFYSIACAFGDVDPVTLAAANGLAISAPLTTGQVLHIP